MTSEHATAPRRRRRDLRTPGDDGGEQPGLHDEQVAVTKAERDCGRERGSRRAARGAAADDRAATARCSAVRAPVASSGTGELSALRRCERDAAADVRAAAGGGVDGQRAADRGDALGHVRQPGPGAADATRSRSRRRRRRSRSAARRRCSATRTWRARPRRRAWRRSAAIRGSRSRRPSRRRPDSGRSPSAIKRRRRRRVLRRGRQRRAQPEVAQDRRVDAAGEVAQLLHGVLEAVADLGQARRDLGVVGASSGASASLIWSATSCCWAPSWRSRSTLRRSASPAVDDPARASSASSESRAGRARARATTAWHAALHEFGVGVQRRVVPDRRDRPVVRGRRGSSRARRGRARTATGSPRESTKPSPRVDPEHQLDGRVVERVGDDLAQLRRARVAADLPDQPLQRAAREQARLHDREQEPERQQRSAPNATAQPASDRGVGVEMEHAGGEPVERQHRDREQQRDHVDRQQRPPSRPARLREPDDEARRSSPSGSTITAHARSVPKLAAIVGPVGDHQGVRRDSGSQPASGPPPGDDGREEHPRDEPDHEVERHRRRGSAAPECPIEPPAGNANTTT